MAGVDSISGIPEGTILVNLGTYQELLDQVTKLTAIVDTVRQPIKLEAIPKGWIASGFEPYATSGANMPRYGVSDGTLYLYGALKNTKEFTGSSETFKVMTIPKDIAEPAEELRIMQQGSSLNTFQLIVKYNGEVHISRYGTNSYAKQAAGGWLNLGIAVKLKA